MHVLKNGKRECIVKKQSLNFLFSVTNERSRNDISVVDVLILFTVFWNITKVSTSKFSESNSWYVGKLCLKNFYTK